MTDFRALCAELLQALETEGYAHWTQAPNEDELCLRARAALAQPEPVDRRIWTEGICGDGAAILKDGVMQPIESVIATLNAAELAKPEPQGPGPDDVTQLYYKHGGGDGMYGGMGEVNFEEAVEEALARWGRPAEPGLQGPTDEEWDALKERVWDRHRTVGYQGELFIYDRDFDTALDVIRQELTRWGRPAIEPVPVAERLPGPEDCDAEGMCWWWHPDHKDEEFGDGWMLLKSEWADGRHDADHSLIYTHWLPHWALPVPKSNSITQGE